jgi:hypothetical protein
MEPLCQRPDKESPTSRGVPMSDEYAQLIADGHGLTPSASTASRSAKLRRSATHSFFGAILLLLRRPGLALRLTERLRHGGRPAATA